MSNVFDHLHIKRHTAGSSNELSFDVLDAARNDLDSRKRRRWGRGRSSGDQSGTPQVFRPTSSPQPGNSPEPASAQTAQPQATEVMGMRLAEGQATFSGQAEVTRRKRKRRARSVRLWAVGLVVAVGMVAASAYVAYGYYERMQDFRQQFDSIIQEFVAVDQGISSMDEFMADPLGASSASREQLGTQFAYADARLQGIDAESNQLVSQCVTDADSMALEQVSRSASSRRDMIAAATQALAVAENAATGSSEFKAVWNDVLEADQQARDATALANEASTNEAIKEARRKTVKAKEQMESSLSELEAISDKVAELDVTDYAGYLTTRIGALEHAIATSDALLAEESDKAVEENDAYNKADKEAAALAEKLAPSLNAVVEESFAQEVENCAEAYRDARDAAIDADALIRDYLG